jgi:enoyl-CoA hydratase/carnithine racemase
VIDLRREGNVFLLTMEDEENRFRHDSNAAWGRALDEVEASDSPVALVTTGRGKFYSNGLDLDWALGNEIDFEVYLSDVLGILERILTLPCITVAAINGHAFGAGALISLCHDFRVMRSDRGYWCMPEIDMGAPLHPGMIAVLKARLPKQTFHEVLVTGKRFGGEEAAERGIVNACAREAEVIPRALALAESLEGKAHRVMRRLKSDAYPEVIEGLRSKMP